METEDMQTMNSTTNQLLTETYTSLCPIIIHYINRKINDYESARDMAQDVFLFVSWNISKCFVKRQ